MTTQQISVFIENKSGTMLQVLDALKEAGIQIIASTISDTVEYGIYRIICSNPCGAYDLLKSKGLSVTITDVFAIELDNQPGEAAAVMSSFAKAGINISYMYSFLVHGKGILVFRTSDTDKTSEIISLNNFRFLTTDKLCQVAE